MTDLSVGVITYRRPDKLERLLASLEDVDHPAPWNWSQTIIVDNDPAGSAKQTVERWVSRLPGVVYVAERNTGLSTARNAAVSQAIANNSDWLAFIDDDEESSPAWLTQLAETQRATDADAVVGNTVFAFETTPPKWLAGSGVYDFEPDVGNGADTTYLSTNNLLLRTALVDTLGALFDERFSKTGGEDHHLGHRLVRGGYKVVQSAHGLTTEWVPADRMDVAVVLKRLQRDGNTLALVDLSFATSPSEKRKVRVHHLIEGIAKLPLGVVRAVVYSIRDGRSGALRGLKTSVIGTGQLKAVAGKDVLGYHVDSVPT